MIWRNVNVWFIRGTFPSHPCKPLANGASFYLKEGRNGVLRRFYQLMSYRDDLFVCFGSVTAFVPRGQIPRVDLRRASLPSRPLVTPGPRCSSCPLSPHTYVMHPASGQYPPPPSCPVQISYQVSGVSPPSSCPTHIFNPHKYIHLEPGRNSLLLTNSSNGSFSCRKNIDSRPQRRTFI